MQWIQSKKASGRKSFRISTKRGHYGNTEQLEQQKMEMRMEDKEKMSLQDCIRFCRRGVRSRLKRKTLMITRNVTIQMFLGLINNLVLCIFSYLHLISKKAIKGD